MNRRLLKELEIRNIPTETTFVQLANLLWDGGFTGPTLVHWLHGRPQLVEFPREQTAIQLTTPARVLTTATK